MADIFLSYSSSDREMAQALASRLMQEGWSVWWDREILPGKSFDDVIDDALLTSKCVVVLWSKASVSSDWVRSEAEEGRKRDILVPALIEEARVPLAFRRIQTANIIDWRTSASTPEFDRFLKAIRALLADLKATSPVPQEPGLVQRAEPGRKLDGQPLHVDLNQFLTQTYEAWLAGKLSGLSPSAQSAARQEGLEVVKKSLEESFGGMLQAILRIGAFEEEEFLVAATAQQSFLMTSRMLYLFQQNSAAGPVTPIRLADIKSYRLIEGFWQSRMEFLLKNGEKLLFKGFSVVVKEEYVKAFMD